MIHSIKIQKIKTSSVKRGKVNYLSQYLDVFNDFPVEPVLADKVIQNKCLNSLYEGGYYDKAEFLDIFSTHTGGGLLNWKSPGTFNPTVVNAPVFTQYGGYKGDAGHISLNFIPSTDGTLIGRDNICVILGIGDNVSEDIIDFGASGAAYAGGIFIKSRDAANNVSFRLNNLNSASVANVNSIAHYAMSRNNAANFDYYINDTKTNVIRASDILCANNLIACGFNLNGIIYLSTKTIRYVFLFSSLTETEVLDVMNIMEEYLDNYSMGCIA